ncbi:hypothetical protein [Hirschia litorea]|uniref:Uncharacterized protein n=1 Tax=Hirschia litorea TaxID=1199156 RepID=A0ABW2IKF5_9PROT
MRSLLEVTSCACIALFALCTSAQAQTPFTSIPAYEVNDLAYEYDRSFGVKMVIPFGQETARSDYASQPRVGLYTERQYWGPVRELSNTRSVSVGMTFSGNRYGHFAGETFAFGGAEPNLINNGQYSQAYKNDYGKLGFVLRSAAAVGAIVMQDLSQDVAQDFMTEHPTIELTECAFARGCDVE